MRFLPATLALLLPAAALAQDGRAYAPGPAMMGFGFGLGVTMLLLMLVLILGPLAFWIMMVIDATKREWPERNMWLIVLWFSLFFGLYLVSALLYYFLVKAKNVGKLPPAPKV